MHYQFNTIELPGQSKAVKFKHGMLLMRKNKGKKIQPKHILKSQKAAKA